jgi:ribose/xylose/arabinose/galactoside ABC-type transport system permease subunit
MQVIVRIKNKRGKTIILTLAGILFLLVWAPWITDDYAINKVVEKLGGPDTRFNYLGEEMVVRDIPKVVSWFPFGRYVTFPGEAGWFVSFYGKISP